MATQTCDSCERTIESAADVQVESVPVADEVEKGLPKFGGAALADLYKCAGCGTPYALKNEP